MCNSTLDIESFPAGAMAVTFGAGDILNTPRNIWLDDVQCSGIEDNLFDCPSNLVAVTNCNHTQDAGVICQDRKFVQQI